MTPATMTWEELRQLPPVVDLETAGRALGIGRSKAYDLAQRDEFPARLLKVGNTYRVITADLHRLLGLGQVGDGRSQSNGG